MKLFFPQKVFQPIIGPFFLLRNGPFLNLHSAIQCIIAHCISNRRTIGARPACRPGRATNQGYLYLLSCSSHFHYRFLHKMRGSYAKSTAGLMPEYTTGSKFIRTRSTPYNSTPLFILFSLTLISFTLQENCKKFPLTISIK